MLTSRYIAGEAAAVIRPGGIAVVGPEIGDDAASVLWHKTERTMASEAIEVILKHFGHDFVPFASAALGADGLHVAARGGARAEVQDGAGVVHIVGDGAGQLVKRVFPDALRVTVLLPEHTPRLGEGWQVESGLVGASQVTSFVEPTAAVEATEIDDLLDDLDATVIASPASLSRSDDIADVELISELVAAANPHFERESADLATSSNGNEATSSPYKLVLGSGIVVELDRPVIVGRAPIDPRSEYAPQPHLVAFDSPGRGISRTHAMIEQGINCAVVTDLNSTNGVEVLIPGRGKQRLAAGVPLSVPAGTVVDIGEGATFLVQEV
ncbi:FHA domain-containing protein [Rarobacter incanus]|uniref:FHA domain-containing protein n=1 Tax=Rarobacter incanus TaxID=153494 RepID=A0A542SQW9_9MICO|nr:FHA domain-containing protein [Rarobacter incanus]TQK77010.1 FHA domain-containing protein [Rarobacter incanus]